MGILKKLFGGKEETGEPVSSPPPPPEPEPIRINEISPQELNGWLNNGRELVVVDMRQPWEYQSGHIPGAINMFIQHIPARFNELPKDTDIVFQCWHGNTSLDASGFLIQNGWGADRVFSLSGGIAGWVQTHGRESLVQD